MKINISILLIGFGLLIGFFFCLCAMKPEVTYQNTMKVAASPLKPFQVFTDTNMMKLRLTGLVSIEYMQGQMNSPDSKWKRVFHKDGKTFEITETMTAYETGRRFSFILENEVMENVVDIRFMNSYHGTLLAVANRVRGRNIFCRSRFVKTTGLFKDQSQKMYDNLRDLINQDQRPA